MKVKVSPVKISICLLVIFIGFFSINCGDSDGDGGDNSFEPFPEEPVGVDNFCTDFDNDGYFAEDGCGTTVDCDDEDPNNWDSCETCLDADSDTYYTGCDAYVTIDGPDCNDGDPAINPGVTEIVCDNVDQNCSGMDDETQDVDSDGYDICDTADPYNPDGNAIDCDDADQNVWDACTTCNDDDSDTYYELCNQYIGINGPDCDDAIANVWDDCADCADGDGDSWGAGTTCDDTEDCDDTDININPEATEVCDDGFDNDCDGDVDCDDSDCISWTWISGSNETNQNGVYGTKGVPATANVPGGRWDAVSWIDASDNLWLFGGHGYDGSGSEGYLNDLWRWDGTNWTWISGSNIIDQGGVYGTKGVPDPANVPGARCGAVSWIDSSGNLWLYGGRVIEIPGGGDFLNDLWRWDGTNWTWMSGSNRVNEGDYYGDTTARYSPISWIDSLENMYLFGGFSFQYEHGETQSFGPVNNFYKWDGSEWILIGGSNWVWSSGTYGTKGVPDSQNWPGSRWAAVSWADASGNMWLFGGFPFGMLVGGYRNDLWRWDGTYWTWMSGSNSGNQNGIYGTKGEPDPGNVPGAREEAVSLKDGSGNLWLFGGHGYPESGSIGPLNDLWRWDGTNWTWISGSNVIDQTGVYGTKGVPDPANIPGAREGAVSWVDSSGYMWIFGGEGYDESGNYGYLNDLWRFE